MCDWVSHVPHMFHFHKAFLSDTIHTLQLRQMKSGIITLRHAFNFWRDVTGSEAATRGRGAAGLFIHAVTPKGIFRISSAKTVVRTHIYLYCISQLLSNLLASIPQVIRSCSDPVERWRKAGGPLCIRQCSLQHNCCAWHTIQRSYHFPVAASPESPLRACPTRMRRHHGESQCHEHQAQGRAGPCRDSWIVQQHWLRPPHNYPACHCHNMFA